MGKILGIIPARGGSKGIPRKNFKTLGGVPLIRHTFDACFESSLINHIVLSSEDPDILDYAVKYVDIVKRPTELAQDDSDIPSVLRHVLNTCPEYLTFTHVVLLYPTYPFRTGKILDEVIEHAVKNNCSNIITIKPAEYPAEWLMDMEKGILNPSFPELGVKYRRQLCPRRYELSGMVQVIRMDYMQRLNKHVRTPNWMGYVIEGEDRSWRMLDLDTMDDWLYAEYLYDRFVKEK